ncbi:MAG: hypothetical protein AAGI38_21260, partial [Bacteroidota bacterium]
GPTKSGDLVDTMHLIQEVDPVTNQLKGRMGLFGPVPIRRPRPPLGSEFADLSYEERLRNYGIAIAY